MNHRMPAVVSTLSPLLLVVLAEAAAWAAPHIAFDCVETIACGDVTPASFAERLPEEKLVEAVFPISMLSRGGEAGDMITCLYRIESLERTMAVHDYQPKTTMASEVIGTIAIEEKEGNSKSLGIVANGGWDHYLKATANASRGSDRSESRRYTVAPPLELLSTSGTVNRGAGVYYKLRPSSQVSLEGAKQFTVTFRVPAAWRGGYVRLTCEAACGSSASDQTVCGREELNVGLYLEGDIEAKAVAEQFADTAFEMRRIVAQRQRDIRNRSLPTPLHEVAAFMSVVDPKIPSTWLRHVVLSPITAPAGDYLRHLPADVRDCVNDYREAKLHLHLLHGKEAWRVELLKPVVESTAAANE